MQAAASFTEVFTDISLYWLVFCRNTYKDCSKSNACYFDIRGASQWYDSREWAFLSIFCYSLLSCDRPQLRGSLTEWCLTEKCVWSKGMEMNSSTQKKHHPLTFIRWHLLVQIFYELSLCSLLAKMLMVAILKNCVSQLRICCQIWSSRGPKRW